MKQMLFLLCEAAGTCLLYLSYVLFVIFFVPHLLGVQRRDRWEEH